MAENKTGPTGQPVESFLSQVEPARRRDDGFALARLVAEVTGYKAVMWGPSMVGYGRYDYTYKAGRQGSFLATGFSPRKASLSIYIMPGYANFAGLLDRLGKHKTGRSCLYVNKLSDIDQDVLAQLIRAGLKDLETYWPVHPV